MAEQRNVFVWQWGRFGAGPRYAYELARAIRIHTDWKPQLSISENSDLYQELPDKSEVQFPVNTRGKNKYSFLYLLRFPKIAFRLRQFLLKNKPVAAICCMVSVYDYFVVYLLQKQNTPVFIIIHDATSHPGDPYDWVVRLQLRLLKKSTGLITLSEFVRRELKLSENAPQISSCVIPHPSFEFPDLSLPVAQPPAYPNGKPIKLLFAGRLKPYKGGKILAEAIAALPDYTFDLRISGDCKNEDWVHSLKTLDHCTLDLHAYWHTETELVAAIDAADLVLAPYVEASQSGIIALALARGRPVVATPVGGLPEQLVHGKSGLIAREISGQAVAEQIHRFIDEPELFKQCANGAAEQGIETNGWKKLAPRFTSFLEKAISPEK